MLEVLTRKVLFARATSLSGFVNKILSKSRRFGKKCIEKLPVSIELRKSRKEWRVKEPRMKYQMSHIDFVFKKGDKVLDVGSGGYPFGYATVFVDRFLGVTAHRTEKLERDGRLMVSADIEALPFRTKQFDFVYCSHVIEHVDDPIAACSELMRVGASGYIESPTRMKDILFSWARGMHKWHIVGIDSNLCFFRYTERELDGINSNAWKGLVLGKWRHPLQEAFDDNQDLFNVMFNWRNGFNVVVFNLDGSILATDVKCQCY